MAMTRQNCRSEIKHDFLFNQSGFVREFLVSLISRVILCYPLPASQISIHLCITLTDEKALSSISIKVAGWINIITIAKIKDKQHHLNVSQYFLNIFSLSPLRKSSHSNSFGFTCWGLSSENFCHQSNTMRKMVFSLWRSKHQEFIFWKQQHAFSGTHPNKSY